MKAISGIGKAVGSIAKGIGKAFKAVVKSPIGRVALLAAGVYLGGAAMGMWDSAFPAVNGALSGAPVATEAVAAGNAGSMLASAPATTLTDAGTSAIGEAVTNAAGGSTATGAGQTLTEVAANAAPVVDAIGQGAAPVMEAGRAASVADKARLLSGGGGIINNALGFAQKNPLLAAVGLNAAAGAFQPSQIDILDEKYKKEQEQYRFLQDAAARNQNIGNVNLGVGAPQPVSVLRDANGLPVYGTGGIINGARRV